MAASQAWDISSTWEVAEEGSSLANYVTVRDVSDGVGALENVCVRLVPGPEKQSCEVTVRFTQQQHAIHCIDVVSTARTCEVYRQSEGDTDVEYVCTTRGQAETTSSLYRAEMDMEDPEFCTSVTIRLLSVKEKSHVIIGRILVLVSPGAYLAAASAAPVQAAVGGASAASLGAMMPLMMQMAQGFSMPDLKNKMSFISAESARVPSHVMKRGPSPAPPSPAPPSPAPPSPAKSEALLEDVCQRLERLESVCARIESSLSKTLESFDKRLQILESGAGRPTEA